MGQVTCNYQSINPGVFFTPVKKIPTSGRNTKSVNQDGHDGIAASLQMAQLIILQLSYVIAIRYDNWNKKLPSTIKKKEVKGV